jgi:S-DNA-T family DNA segregation ATPase FtsK/SpoIIIE
LVIGPTGSGKSELLNLVLASVDPGIELTLADYKGGAILTEVRVAQVMSDLEDQSTQNAFWMQLDSELQTREGLLRAAGFASWEQAERQGAWRARKLVVVDEVVAAIRGCPKALETLTRIATKGRSLGIHLLVTSQSLVGIPREVLINLRSRLALAGTDEVELLQLGCKEKLGESSEQTKAAVLMHDGQTFRLQVPMGARRAPRPKP